jgi:hypothetical protein
MRLFLSLSAIWLCLLCCPGHILASEAKKIQPTVRKPLQPNEVLLILVDLLIEMKQQNAQMTTLMASMSTRLSVVESKIAQSSPLLPIQIQPPVRPQQQLKSNPNFGNADPIPMGDPRPTDPQGARAWDAHYQLQREKEREAMKMIQLEDQYNRKYPDVLPGRRP